MIALEFENVTKSFTATSDQSIIRNLSFQVNAGEFFSFLGPSGCGKTTCLRMISGLEKPTSGFVRINGQIVNNIHPHKRNVHMVFQKYALFPHLNVFENVAFGLRMKRLGNAEIRSRVERMLKMVHLDRYSTRSIQKLSGGEQQRVALVRALVNEPAILLLDEPLGALDLKLREEMQQELATIQKQLGTTFIFVTHDQGEALTLSDRIAIMNRGRIEQIGTPTEIYENPASLFVSKFVGTSNSFCGRLLSRENSSVRFELPGAGPLIVQLKENVEIEENVRIVVRPEKIRIRVTSPDTSSSQSTNCIKGTLLERTYFGPTTQIKLSIGSDQPPLIALIANQSSAKMPPLRIGEKYFAVWDASDGAVVPAHESEASPV